MGKIVSMLGEGWGSWCCGADQRSLRLKVGYRGWEVGGKWGWGVWHF